MAHTLNFKGHRLTYYVEGKGESILFLHGWPTNAQLWSDQVAALKDHYRCIRIDWLGFGNSDKPSDYQYTFTHKKEILSQLMAEILAPEEKINLVAHDIGGPAAILWADENPEKVKRLILLNTVVYPMKTPLDASSEFILHTPLLRDIFVSPFGIRQVLKTNTKSGRAGLKEKIDEICAPFLQVESAIKRRTLTEPLGNRKKNEVSGLSHKFKKLEAEKHLIIAAQDPLCYAHIKKLSEENPEVPRHYIEKCGHFIAIDQPEKLNAILFKILNSQASF